MWGFTLIVITMGLCFLAIEDGKTKHISLKGLIIWAVLVMIGACFSMDNHLEGINRLLGLCVGVGCLFISRWSKEGLGYGDSFVICILGIGLGIERLLQVLCMSFVLCFLYGVFHILIRKMSREDQIAFVPFLFLGFVVVVVGGGL